MNAAGSERGGLGRGLWIAVSGTEKLRRGRSWWLTDVRRQSCGKGGGLVGIQACCLGGRYWLVVAPGHEGICLNQGRGENPKTLELKQQLDRRIGVLDSGVRH